MFWSHPECVCSAYFGPELPDGAPEGNWLRTVPGRGWFTLLRLYSPTEAFFDKTWRPGDFEKLP